MKKVFQFLLAALSLSLVGCNNNQKEQEKQIERKHSGESATNPLAPDLGLYDPAIIKGNDGYYYGYFVEMDIDTDGDGDLEKSLAPIFKSKDLVSWTYVGSVFSEESQAKWEGTSSLSIWSPEIAYINGKYVYYYSLGMMGYMGDTRKDGIGVAVSSTPYGPWEYKGKLLDGYTVNNWDPIDPNIVIDNGKVYMFYGNFDGIGCVELSSDGLSLKGTPTIVAGEHNTTTKLVEGHSPIDNCNDYSAPCVKKIDGTWYLFVSNGAWNKEYAKTSGYKYHEVVFKSNNLLGPYKDSAGNLAFEKNVGDTVCDSGETFLNPGCGCIVEDDGNNYYIFCQAYFQSTSNSRLFVMDQLDVDNGMPHTKNKIINETFEKPYIIKQNN